MSSLSNMGKRSRVWASAALVTAGLAGGGILGTTLSAGAATTSSSTGSAATSSAGTGTNGAAATAPDGQPPGPPHGRACALPRSGTVTGVGSSSVTIDNTTYSVTANSDIDKNGEAKLSDLAVGDKVTFSTVASASTPTIDRLHAGNEALDRPAGPPPGAPPGGPGQPGTSS